MSCDFLAQALPGVQKLSPYVPGKPVDELARELNLDPLQIVKLASNENPLGPSPRALEAIAQALGELTRTFTWFESHITLCYVKNHQVILVHMTC